MNGKMRHNEEGPCEEEEHEEHASAGDQKGLKEGTADEDAKNNGGEENGSEAELTRACAECERGGGQGPGEVKRSGEEGKEEEEEREEEKEVVEEREFEGDELEEEESEAEKEEEERLEEAKTIHGEG